MDCLDGWTIQAWCASRSPRAAKCSALPTCSLSTARIEASTAACFWKRFLFLDVRGSRSRVKHHKPGQLSTHHDDGMQVTQGTHRMIFSATACPMA